MLLRQNMLIIGLIGDCCEIMDIKWQIHGPLKYFLDQDINVLYMSFETKNFNMGITNYDIKDYEYSDSLMLLLMIYLAHVIIITVPSSTFDITLLKRFQMVDYLKHKVTPLITSALVRDVSSSQNKSTDESESIFTKTFTSCIKNLRPPRLLFAFTKCPLTSAELENTLSELDFSEHKTIPEYLNHHIPYILKKANPIKRMEHIMEDQIYHIFKPASFLSSSNPLVTFPFNQEFVFISPPQIFDCKSVKTDKDVNNYMVDPIVQGAFDELCEKMKSTIWDKTERDDKETKVPERPLLYDFCPTRGDDKLNVKTAFLRFLASHIATRKSEINHTLGRNHSRFGARSIREGGGALKSGSDEDTDIAGHEFSFYFDENAPTLIHPKTYAKIIPGSNSKSEGRLIALNWYQYAKILVGLFDPAYPFNQHQDMLLLKENVKSLLGSFFSKFLDPHKQLSNIIIERAAKLAQSYFVENLPPLCTAERYNHLFEEAVELYNNNARGSIQDILFGMQQLRKDCKNVWYCHRPCEAVSLTGHPCLLKFHKYPLDEGLINENNVDTIQTELHKSKFKSMSFCDCGATLTVRPDPFTTKEANWDFYEKLRVQCCRPKFKLFLGSDKDKSILNTSNEENVHGGFDTLLQSNILKTVEPEYYESFSKDSNDIDSRVTKYFKLHYAMTYAIADDMQTSISFDLKDLCFNSWSLVHYGPSTSYINDTGLDGANYLLNSNFLLPWFDTIESGPDGQLLSSNQAIPFHFMCGLEYECQLGHRFIYNNFDTWKQSSNSSVKRQASANKVMNKDMPIWIPCSCRSTNKAWAQLARLYVLVPNTPVKIRLNIAVSISEQLSLENEDQLIDKNTSFRNIKFYPDILKEDLILAPNSFWSLRFPYIYYSQFGAHLPSKSNPSSLQDYAKLEKGFFEFVV